MAKESLVDLANETARTLSVTVKALATALRDIVDVLTDAEPGDRAHLDEELGITLTYDPSGQVHVQALPRGVQVRVGGGT